MDETIPDESKVWGLGYGGWVAVYLAAMAAAAAAYIAGLVPGRYGFLVMFLPLVLVPAMSRAQMKWLRDRGISSSALSQYARRVTAAVLAVVICFLLAAYLAANVTLSPAAAFVAAAVAILPAYVMLWAMARYLSRETDEYLRTRAVRSALFGLFLVLAVGTEWGVLEMFGLVPGISSLWVFPVWAIGLGLGHCWQWMRGA